MAEHKDQIGFRVPKYLKDWIDKHMDTGQYTNISEFMVFVLNDYRMREDIRDIIIDELRKEIKKPDSDLVKLLKDSLKIE